MNLPRAFIVLALCAAMLTTACAAQSPAAGRLEPGAVAGTGDGAETDPDTPATPAAGDARVIRLYSAPFGTGTYNLFTGLEALFAEHPTIRISHRETPGFVWNAQALAENPDLHVDTLFGTGRGLLSFAEKGVNPFEAPLPVSEWRILAGLFGGGPSIVTLDPDLATDPRNLAGKTIGLGRAPQVNWAVQPEMMLDAYGITYRSEYLGPVEATQALLDGRVDAAVQMLYASPDLSVIMNPPALEELLASGRAFYWVGFDAATTQAEYDEAGVAWRALELPPGTAPNQPQPIVISEDFPAMLAAHRDLPDDVAYEIVTALLNNPGVLAEYNALGRLTTPETMAFAVERERYHPGAARAYIEAGLWD